eukprot:4461775-Alexandrium_andersonii.AAC.1
MRHSGKRKTWRSGSPTSAGPTSASSRPLAGGWDGWSAADLTGKVKCGGSGFRVMTNRCGLPSTLGGIRA